MQHYKRDVYKIKMRPDTKIEILKIKVYKSIAGPIVILYQCLDKVECSVS